MIILKYFYDSLINDCVIAKMLRLCKEFCEKKFRIFFVAYSDKFFIILINDSSDCMFTFDQFFLFCQKYI